MHGIGAESPPLDQLCSSIVYVVLLYNLLVATARLTYLPFLLYSKRMLPTSLRSSTYKELQLLSKKVYCDGSTLIFSLCADTLIALAFKHVAFVFYVTIDLET